MDWTRSFGEEKLVGETRSLGEEKRPCRALFFSGPAEPNIVSSAIWGESVAWAECVV